MKKSILFICLTFHLVSFTQNEFVLAFKPMFNNQDYILNTEVISPTGTKIKITDFNYYISNVKLIYNNGQVFELGDTVFLVKSGSHFLDLGQLNINNVEKISFGIGVPEELNHLDIAAYPLDHPLSFQEPSMHWGWAAGYMHMIISGLADSDDDGTVDKLFEIHSLGDKNYHEIEVFVKEELNLVDQNVLTLFCNIDTWLNNIDLKTIGIKHGENGVNQSILKVPTTSPVFTSNYSYLKIDEKADKIGGITYKKLNQSLEINWNNLLKINRYEFVNSNGQVLKSENSKEINSATIINDLSPGMYFFSCYSSDNKLLNQIKIIF
jgi:hypothetical protein